MEKKDLEKLIAKYLSGSDSIEDNRELEKWYASFEDDDGFTNKLSDADREELERRLLFRIDQKISMLEGKGSPEKTAAKPAEVFRSGREIRPVYAYAYKIAAVLTGLIILGIITYESFIDNTVVHATAYGETLHITLPDSSKVMLNGNSTFTYEDTWDGEGAREVYLDGEAFFWVTHTSSNQKFIVNISDKLSVEVLGTKFNVSKRKSATRVVLNSGKIHLNLRESSGSEHIVMKPGELVEFKESPSGYIKKTVNPEIYSAWRNKKLIFDNTSLRQVLVILEENYGLEAHIEDKSLLDQEVSGSIPAENIDVLLKNISVTYGIDVQKKGDLIEIHKASN